MSFIRRGSSTNETFWLFEILHQCRDIGIAWACLLLVVGRGLRIVTLPPMVERNGNLGGMDADQCATVVPIP